MTLALPDCKKIDIPVSLSDDEKRQLVLAIAEGGVEAVDKWIEERAKTDSSIARRVRAMRDELLAKAEELRRRLAGEFSAAKESRTAAFEAEREALTRQREEVAREIDFVRVRADADAERAGLEVDLVRLALEARSTPAPWWRRAWLALGRALRWLLSLLLSPLRLLLRKGKPEKRRGRIAILRRGVAVDLAAVGSDPRLRRAVRDRLRTRPLGERVRDAWNRLLAREDYEDLVRTMMEQEMRSSEDRVRSAASEREDEMRRRISELTEDEESRRRALDDALARLERERREAEDAMSHRADRDPFDAARRDVMSELEDAGLLKFGATGWGLTEKLIDRFAEIVLAEEQRRMGSTRGRATGLWSDGEGLWQREPYRTEADLAHMDMLASVVRARGRTLPGREVHLYEEDVVVYREERGQTRHVVIIFDRSGSMEEHGRLDAAKRAVLALHRAVKRENPGNRADILAMSTGVERLDLVGVWEAQPKGFTNTGGALKKAGDLLGASRAEGGVVYLITDGLPEAWTRDGEDVAGAPEKALAYALEQARALKARGSVELAIVLLEVDDPLYVKAAEAIAKEVRGRVFKAKPEELAQKMLRDFDRTGPARVAKPAR